MTTTTATPLSHRDRAVLRAAAAGRVVVADAPGIALLIDGLACCDQEVGPRLVRAGLITADSRPGYAYLTPPGQALLEAAREPALAAA